MHRVANRIDKAGKVALSTVRLARLRARLGRNSLPGRHYIGPGVRVSVTSPGRLSVGSGGVLQANVTLQVRGHLAIGPDAFIGEGTVIVARDEILIGRDVLIAEHVTIRDQNHAYGGALPTSKSGFVTAPIRIGDNVWLGAKVTVLKGVSIGNNVVVGANSVVTRDLPDNVVAVGAPARVVRAIDVQDART